MIETKTEKTNLDKNVVKAKNVKTTQEIMNILWEEDKIWFNKNNDLHETPIPSQASIDINSISDWINLEEDSDFKHLKEKLIKNIQHIDFANFQEKLSFCIEIFNKKIDDNYAVMRDYKPHSSKRWTYKLIEKKLTKKPIYSNFFNPSAEKSTIKTIEHLQRNKVNTFVTIDDSAYSGEQVFNRFLIPIVKDFELHYPNEKPEFYVVIPFITNSFKEKIDTFILENNCTVTLIYSEIMPQIKDIVTKEELHLMNEKRNGSIELDADEPLYHWLTLTFFDHRVADDHSFSPEIAKVIKVKYEKPYKESDSIYSKREKEEFQKYWKPYQEHINKI